MLNRVLRLFGKTCKFVQMHDALNKAEVVHPRSSFPRNGLWSQGLRVSRPLGTCLYLKALRRLCCVPAGSDAAPSTGLTSPWKDLGNHTSNCKH